MDHEQELKAILFQNELLSSILEKASTLDLPDWYLGAGAIAQTVWNYKNGFDLSHGITDYDLVYFDTDITEEKQNQYVRKAKELFGGLRVDIVNEARVHLWYRKQFGTDIAPYTSTESAIDTWPTTATSIGIKKTADGTVNIYAPFGLHDLFSLTIRANKNLISKAIYQQKVEKWLKVWPNLNVIPW